MKRGRSSSVMRGEGAPSGESSLNSRRQEEGVRKERPRWERFWDGGAVLVMLLELGALELELAMLGLCWGWG